MDPALRCEHDQDDNGLDDELELQLGKCLAPQLRFHSGHVEPPTRVLFNAHAVNTFETSSGHGVVRVNLHYAYLWPEDLGFTEADCDQEASDECEDVLLPGAYESCYGFQWSLCSANCYHNGHAGDSQSLDVVAEVSFTQGRWRAAPLQLDGLSFVDGHQVTYLSPGKHHFYGNARSDQVYEVAPIGYDCHDPHDGLGGTVVYDDLKHVPVSTLDPTSLVEFDATGCWLAPGLCEDAHWVNACVRRRDGVAVASERLGTPRLDMPGCGFYQQSFCGASGKVAAMMQWGRSIYDDPDRDHVPNAADPCPLLPEPEGNRADGDHDQLPDACDPDPKHPNEYVGGGGARSDGSVAKGTVARLSPTAPFVPAATLGGGYADADGDNVADGRDLCPNLAAQKADVEVPEEWYENDWNQAGMSLDLERASDPERARVIAAQTGYAHRANTCDPYPVSRTNASPNATMFCKGLVEYPLGASEVPIETQLFVGKSANDRGVVKSRTYLLAGQRCNCGTRWGCLNNQNDDCFSGTTHADTPTLWRGWRGAYRPGCVPDDAGYCHGAETTLTEGVTTPLSSRWHWFEEYPVFPEHFRPGSVVFESPTPLNPGGYWKSLDNYAIGSVVEEGADFTSAPGASLTFDPMLALYGEPDTGSDGAMLKLDLPSNEESRRLRASRHAAPFPPSQEHQATMPTGYCLPQWHGDLSFLDDPILEIGDLRAPVLERTTRLVVGRAGPLLGDVALLDGAANRRRTVSPAASVPGWLRQGAGAFSVLRVQAGWFAPAATEAVASLASTTGLFWIEQGLDGASRWAMLAPTSQADDTVTYSVVREGTTTFLLSSSGVVVTDARANTVAVVDPATALLASYDIASDTWTTHETALVNREGASYVLDGTTLFVAGGARDGVPSVAVALLDIRDGRGFERPGFPPRTRPVLTLARDAHVLVQGGGVSLDGREHDDVWTLDTTQPASVARQLKGDTVGGSMQAGKALLEVNVTTGAVSAHFQTSQGWTEARDRLDGGWRGTDASASLSGCRSGDDLGGQLCPLPGAGVWSSPGRLTCATDEPAHACQGALGEILATTTLAAHHILDADVSADTLWTLTRRGLERRRLRADLAVMETVKIDLGSRARDLAASDDGALVATDAGFAWVGNRATAATVVDACGDAVRVAKLGERRWIGVTTVGIATISTETGAPVITAEALLLPKRGDDGLELTRVPSGAAGRLLCRATERALGARTADRLGDATALEGVGEREALVGRGTVLARVRFVSGDFELAGWTLAPGGIDALRFDADGRRAYAATPRGERVLDLRGSGIGASDTTGLGDWTRRRDAGSPSLVIAGSKLHVARVSR